ncbi:MAG: hypothetical protein M3P97_11575 [Actinomycetota bacterium]|nr:hypothetical protein [Actinomycetota bacterium]
MQIRDFGDRSRWRRREGIVATLRRGLDLNHRLALNGVRQLEVAVAEEPAAAEARVVVRLDADVSDQRVTHAWIAGAGATVATGVVAAAPSSEASISSCSPPSR